MFFIKNISKKIFIILIVITLVGITIIPASTSYAAVNILNKINKIDRTKFLNIGNLLKDITKTFGLIGNIFMVKTDNDDDNNQKKVVDTRTKTIDGVTYKIAVDYSKIEALLKDISTYGIKQKGHKSIESNCDNVANYYIDYLFGKQGSIINKNKTDYAKLGKYDLKSSSTSINKEKIKDSIDKGKVIKLHESHGSNKQHWIVVVGYVKSTENNSKTQMTDLLIIDPWYGTMHRGGTGLALNFYSSNGHLACSK